MAAIDLLRLDDKVALDIVGATLLMVSDAGACMTGQTLVIDSGSLISHGLYSGV